MTTFQFLLLLACCIFQLVSYVAYLIARNTSNPKRSEFYWKVSVVSVIAAGTCAMIGIMSN